MSDPYATEDVPGERLSARLCLTIIGSVSAVAWAIVWAGAYVIGRLSHQLPIDYTALGINLMVVTVLAMGALAFVASKEEPHRKD